MANYILSYDLNGAWPSHAMMDQHIRATGVPVARILETVWFVKTSSSLDDLTRYIRLKLSPNDRLMVAEARGLRVQNLLVDDNAVIDRWNQAA